MVMMRKAVVESNPSGKSSMICLPTSNALSSADELEYLRPLPKLLSQCTIIEISSSEEETDNAANGWATMVKKKRTARNNKLVASSSKTSNKLPVATNSLNKNISKNQNHKGCKNTNNPTISSEKHVKPVQGPQQSGCEIGAKKKRSKAKLRREQKRALLREQKKNEEITEIGRLLKKQCVSNMFTDDGAAQTSSHRDFINEPQPTIIGTDYLGDIYEKDFFNKNVSCNNSIEAEVDLWLSIHMSRHNNCGVLLQDYELCSDIIWKDVAGMLIFIDNTKYCSYLIYTMDY